MSTSWAVGLAAGDVATVIERDGTKYSGLSGFFELRTSEQPLYTSCTEAIQIHSALLVPDERLEGNAESPSSLLDDLANTPPNPLAEETWDDLRLPKGLYDSAPCSQCNWSFKLREGRRSLYGGRSAPRRSSESCLS